MNKICHTCGTSNEESARFCSHCGYEFPIENPFGKTEEKKCQQCQAVNLLDAKFCAECGAKLSQEEIQRHHAHQPEKKHHSHRAEERRKEREQQKRAKSSPNYFLLFAGIAGIVILISILFDNNPSLPQPQQQTAPIAEQKSNDAALEKNVLKVASKFICSCGTCGEQPLDICTCGNAVQERQFIRTHLQAGQTVEQVVLAVNTAYGWLKKEFTAQYDSLARKKGASTKITVPPEVQSGLLRVTENSAVIAAASDREEIFSHFRCPCGKCGMDDLKKCACSHANGAKEVKAYVDAQIAEGKYTVQQIISMVEQKYGGRKS